MTVTRKALQECVDKLLPNGHAVVFSSIKDLNGWDVCMGINTTAYLRSDESLSHMPDRVIAALEDVKKLVEYSIATIRENS